MRSWPSIVILVLAGCPAAAPPIERPAPPERLALGAGFGDLRLGKISAVPPQDPALSLHPGRELLAEWLLSVEPSRRTWWLRGADGGPPDAPHALLIYGRGSADRPARSQADAPSWLLRETYEVKRALLGALVTFLPRAVDWPAALARHGIKARGLLLATPRALVYDSSRPNELVFQLLGAAGDDLAILTFANDSGLNYALREFLLRGELLVGKIPFPDALPAGGFPAHSVRRPDLLSEAQRATLELARAALARGPNPAALDQAGVDTTLSDLRRPGAVDVQGRRLGRVTDPKPLPDHWRVRDVPAWTRRFTAAWDVRVDAFPGRNDVGELSWPMLLRAGYPVSAPRVNHAHEAILALPHPTRYPTASAALEPLGATLGPVESIHEGFVLARTSRADVFVVAFPQASTDHGLDGPPAFGMLLLPGIPLRGLYTGAPGIRWAGLEGDALAEATGRLPRRALITLLQAAPLLPAALGGAEPILRQAYVRQTDALLGHVERSPIAAVLAARERVTTASGLRPWDAGASQRIEHVVDLTGQPLGSTEEGLVETTVARRGEYAKVTKLGLERLRTYAADRAARGAVATAEVARQLSFGPDLRWRFDFLLQHVALPALDDPEFQALVGAMPPLVRSLPGGASALRTAMRQAPPERLRTGTFEDLPWEVERCELVTAWGPPAVRVEVQTGAPDPALVRAYEASIAGAEMARSLADSAVLPVQVTHHYQRTDGQRFYGHLYTERHVDPVEHKRHFELQMEAIDAELAARRARDAMLASQTRKVTIFTPRLHSRYVVELCRKVKLESGGRLLERELRHATVLSPASELCTTFEGADPDARPQAAVEAVRTRRAGERTAVIEAARGEAAATRALSTVKTALFRELATAVDGDPRATPRPVGLSEEEWLEERAWRAWWLGLPPAEDERVFIDLAKEIQLY